MMGTPWLSPREDFLPPPAQEIASGSQSTAANSLPWLLHPYSEGFADGFQTESEHQEGLEPVLFWDDQAACSFLHLEQRETVFHLPSDLLLLSFPPNMQK